MSTIAEVIAQVVVGGAKAVCGVKGAEAAQGICQNSEYTLRIPYDSFRGRGQRLLKLDGHTALLATSMLLCGAVF